MGHYGKIVRSADQVIVKRLNYTIQKLQSALQEYQTQALPNTQVMSDIRVSRALIVDIQRQLETCL